MKHTFSICAYGDSPYLEDCIVSLENQAIKSNIIICTSTPSEYISTIAGKYGINLYIRDGESSLKADWNYAVETAVNETGAELVTLAHQDDIYFEEYSLRAVTCLERCKKPLIYFSDYCEIRNGKKVVNNQLLRIKRILLLPLRINLLQRSRFIRRRSLALGNGICCPAVTFAVNNLPNPVFTVNFRSDEYWEAWERISKLKGCFLYDSSIQMGHRIHEESETSIILGDNARSKEDYEMFCKFWPKWMAKIIVKFYSKSEKSNKVN